MDERDKIIEGLQVAVEKLTEQMMQRNIEIDALKGILTLQGVIGLRQDPKVFEKTYKMTYKMAEEKFYLNLEKEAGSEVAAKVDKRPPFDSES